MQSATRLGLSLWSSACRRYRCRPCFQPNSPKQAAASLSFTLFSASLAADLAALSAVRVVSAWALAELSPISNRYDVKAELSAGFPYSLSHASGVAGVLSKLVVEPAPKKGVITDLDDTLWAGLLGEDGVDGISWELDRHSKMHGVYQVLLASLAGAGVLVGVASKNDPSNVERAFARQDLHLTKNDIYPFEVHWSSKSHSVRRILNTWNVGPESVVFVDDSPMELAEVEGAFPEMECLLFPKDNVQAAWLFVAHLRDLFGKSVETDEDRLRLNSIRDAGAWRAIAQSSDATLDEFLRTAEACVTFEPLLANNSSREFELMNKTNQFNLNGRRLTDSDWRKYLNDPDAIALSAVYKDKFGPLGKIMVVMGRVNGRSLILNGWVLSCRAFSRRIEHQCLNYLFESFSADEITFDFNATPRNAPLQEFLTQMSGRPPEPGLVLTREQFAAKVPKLFQCVKGRIHAST